MKKIDVLPRKGAAQPDPAVLRQPRSPPQAVKLLLPVWGYGYIRQFLEFGLPTLLASGNVPALAAALPTEFVVLTSVDDEEYIREHINFKRLAAVCKTEIRLIDHLITDGNYSTTITLAYTEAVCAVGEAMLDTCFFFLVSDYIMADGSLANALKRMQGGTSAVIVGNFQIAHEEALPWLQDRLAGNKHSLALSSRELMRWALNNLHPATLANIINIPFSHNSHTNRLFWRVDGNTILGRFYLMHMLCVRPEITDFIIGASCDYSFVPEMCPSGNVEAITDSDEYLVIEMQPRHHEAAFLRPGPLKASVLAKSLGEWTTSVHRQNAQHTIVFHADELPARLSRSIEAADAFVTEVAHHLANPRPHRGHPYWRGAMAAFHDATGRKLDNEEWSYALGLPLSASQDWFSGWLIHRAKSFLMGQPPRMLPWHPAWPDYQTVLRELRSFFTEPSQRLLMMSNEPTAFTMALADGGERVDRIRCNPFLQNAPGRYAPLHGKFDLCLLELAETDMRHGDTLIDRIVPLMKNDGRIIIFVLNRRIKDQANEFGRSMVFHGARFMRSGALPTEIHFVPANRARWSARRGMANLRVLMNRGGWLGIPLVAVGWGFLACLSLIGNLDSLRRTRRMSSGRHTSSFVMRLAVDAPKITNAHGSLGEGVPRQDGGRNDPARKTDVSRLEATGKAYNGTYNRCIELKNTVGLHSLGLTTNQIWYDDPRHLGILLGRYQFVAKVIGGRANVGEVSYGDAFGTRVVVQQVPDVTVYGPDPNFIKDIRASQDERWPLKAEIHDITVTPLPHRHEAVFSLDLFEHLPYGDEHAALVHLCHSLAEGGMLVIGAPVTDAATGASLAAGEMKCKSGKELRAFLGRYFAEVLMFAVIDDVIQAGLSPAAHYAFAVCTRPKWEEGDLERKESPLFEICEWKRGQGFYVRVTHPNSEPQRVEGFATVADAARWISNQTMDWMRAGRRTSY